MANLTINDIPDDLMAKIQKLAKNNNCSLSEQVIVALEIILREGGPKYIVSPDTDPSWEDRRKMIPELIARIERINEELPTDIEWLDSV
ncbi:MAG: hypothetical protein F6K54_14525 [Okeania sp. SIO3B5]|uniref:hypothetical protein n=1 Tax=Okeania sp. SIO3B5 TaxID=2607811 RepID=UPI00140063D2|nr:hypothetical protein [Okeania sp. SIO3B5]NEO54189.1 hypothetical protein [Okeania sp. SIO3B5]